MYVYRLNNTGYTLTNNNNICMFTDQITQDIH